MIASGELLRAKPKGKRNQGYARGKNMSQGERIDPLQEELEKMIKGFVQ